MPRAQHQPRVHETPGDLCAGHSAVGVLKCPPQPQPQPQPQPAATAAAAGTPADVVELLDAYGLTREDFMENMKELQLCLEGDKELKDLYDSIDTKTKTALTKAYNSASHTSQVLVGEILASKAAGGKKGKKAASADLDPLDVGEEAREEMALLATGNGEEEEEDEKVDLAAFASKKKKSAATKASSSSSKGSKKK
mmetsp:Transcript_18852/g.31803  ORF Transcript_18852/g.31803 Transcript_18852/m.31803 type:complete len:196 (-) Transcript_18852:187-774(-)